VISTALEKTSTLQCMRRSTGSAHRALHEQSGYRPPTCAAYQNTLSDGASSGAVSVSSVGDGQLWSTHTGVPGMMALPDVHAESVHDWTE